MRLHICLTEQEMTSMTRRVGSAAAITFVMLLTPLLVTGCNIPGLGAATGDTSRFDGTYDYNVQFPTPGGGTSSVSCSNCVFIQNGNVTNIDGSFFGGVTDASFGNVEFSGPCPVAGTASYDGILNEGNPKNGSGNYTCIENGVTGRWSFLNGG